MRYAPITAVFLVALLLVLIFFVWEMYAYGQDVGKGVVVYPARCLTLEAVEGKTSLECDSRSDGGIVKETCVLKRPMAHFDVKCQWASLEKR